MKLWLSLQTNTSNSAVIFGSADCVKIRVKKPASTNIATILCGIFKFPLCKKALGSSLPILWEELPRALCVLERRLITKEMQYQNSLMAWCHRRKFQSLVSLHPLSNLPHTQANRVSGKSTVVVVTTYREDINKFVIEFVN